LAREQAEADSRDPDWDSASRITTAVATLERAVRYLTGGGGRGGSGDGNQKVGSAMARHIFE
jgi:hypothetical protein